MAEIEQLVEGLHKVVVWGNPYHGTVTGGSLTLPNTDVISYPQPGTANAKLIGNTSLPDPTTRTAEELAEDAIKGHEWRGRAVLSGEGSLYGTDMFSGGPVRTESVVYIDDDEVPWRLEVTLNSSGEFTVTLAGPMTFALPHEESFTPVLKVGATGGVQGSDDPDVNVNFIGWPFGLQDIDGRFVEQNAEGTEFLILISGQVTDDDLTDPGDGYNPPHNRLLWVWKCTVTGAGGSDGSGITVTPTLWKTMPSLATKTPWGESISSYVIYSVEFDFLESDLTIVPDIDSCCNATAPSSFFKKVHPTITEYWPLDGSTSPLIDWVEGEWEITSGIEVDRYYYYDENDVINRVSIETIGKTGAVFDNTYTPSDYSLTHTDCGGTPDHLLTFTATAQTDIRWYWRREVAAKINGVTVSSQNAMMERYHYSNPLSTNLNLSLNHIPGWVCSDDDAEAEGLRGELSNDSGSVYVSIQYKWYQNDVLVGNDTVNTIDTGIFFHAIVSNFHPQLSRCNCNPGVDGDNPTIDAYLNKTGSPKVVSTIAEIENVHLKWPLNNPVTGVTNGTWTGALGSDYGSVAFPDSSDPTVYAGINPWTDTLEYDFGGTPFGYV